MTCIRHLKTVSLTANANFAHFLEFSVGYLRAILFCQLFKSKLNKSSFMPWICAVLTNRPRRPNISIDSLIHHCILSPLRV